MKTTLSTTIFTALLVAGPLAGAARAETTEQFHSETDTKKTASGDVDTSVKTESVDAAGTLVKHEVKETTDRTAGGGKRARITHTKTTDPKGLMNKSTEKSEAVADYKANGALEKKSTFDGVDAAGTRHKLSSDTETVKKPGGGRRTVMKDIEVQDPKGLGNKVTIQKTTTVDRTADGKAIVSTEKDINGKAVERKVVEPVE